MSKHDSQRFLQFTQIRLLLHLFCECVVAFLMAMFMFRVTLCDLVCMHACVVVCVCVGPRPLRGLCYVRVVTQTMHTADCSKCRTPSILLLWVQQTPREETSSVRRTNAHFLWCYAYVLPSRCLRRCRVLGCRWCRRPL